MKQFYGFINTPPLWKNEQFGLKQFKMPLIDLETFIPKPIPTNLRLGHQIEYIFKQLLDHTEQYEVLAHNIQIKRGNETIGELDFMVRDRSCKSVILHIELTYKFYILDPAISGPIHRLVGPNRKDMFFTKMEKTRDKQLPLVYSPEGTTALTALGIDVNEIAQQTYFVGQLFTPYGETPPSIRPLNPSSVSGFWIRFDTLKSKSFAEYSYYITHKYEWLHQPHLEVAWKTHFEILMEINIKHINNYAPMVWIKKSEKSVEKCFVVWW